MIKITGYDKPMQVLYRAEGGPDGYYKLIPICPRCKNLLCGDEKRCPFCSQKFKFIGRKMMSTNPDFVEFVVSKLEELSKKFKLQNEQYTGETSRSNCGELANFRIGALLKYGQAGYSAMYECAKDYVRKHIAYIESHCVFADSVEESLGDIAIYAVIMMYMKARYEEERKMKIEQLTAEAK